MKLFFTASFFFFCITVFHIIPGQADDTCIFTPSADEVPPNIVMYVDNSEEMLQAVWNSAFDNSRDWTPSGTEAIEGGTAFLNENGYGFYQSNGNASTMNIAPFVEDDGILTLDTTKGVAGNEVLDETGRSYYQWTFDSTTVILPVASLIKALGENNQCNECSEIRYSANYLNWIFFSSSVDDGGYKPDEVDEYNLFYKPAGEDEYITEDGQKNGINRLYLTKQALKNVIEGTENKAKFALYWFDSSDSGVKQNKPLELALEEDDTTMRASFLESINGMQAYSYTPLAEGLAYIAGYYDTEAAHVYGCEKNFILLLSPGVSSQDLGGSGNSNDLSLTAAQYEPDFLSDFDNDDESISNGEGWIIEDMTSDNKDNDGDGEIDEADEAVEYEIPIGYNGSTYLDDIAYYIYNNDVVSWVDGFQNVITYTIGFMGNHVNDLFLINTSNNGNGFTNLYNINDPDYGRYHTTASSPDELVDALSKAINSILERTTVFAAPVVPVTRTTSGDRIYLSFFTPRSENFWEGNVVKYGLNSDNQIVDKYGNPATELNGALIETAEPYWATINWAADPLSSISPEENGIFYSQRPIYTYLGGNTSIVSPENAFNIENITTTLLGNPTHTADEIIDYIRGADVFDDDSDAIVDENRDVITGDVLHSKPTVYEFIHKEGTLTLSSAMTGISSGEMLVGSMGGRAYANGIGFNEDGQEKIRYNNLLSPFSSGELVVGVESGSSTGIISLSDKTMIFFGSNDGMLHAVRDENGTEAWSFIPPHHLSRIKDIIEGDGHSYFVDGTAKIYLIDDDGDGFIDSDGDDDGDGSPDSDPDKVILVCGERMGSNSFFALDITDPEQPQYLWRISNEEDTSFALPIVYPELGESWSEPRFGKVKTSDGDTTGTDALIIGGGYSSDNSLGTKLYILDVLTADLLQEFSFSENYSLASAASPLDINDNDFIDKIYIGDLGGNMYRIGHFYSSDGTLLSFPQSDENITNWESHLLFSANDGLVANRKFYYPPSVTMERGYHLVFMGTGDRNDPCDQDTSDGVFVIKDTHSAASYDMLDLRDVTDPLAVEYVPPNLDSEDVGWYYLLAQGEKVLAKGLVFSEVYYFTTFTPNNDPCMSGGTAKLYGLDYKSGVAAPGFDGFEAGIVIGGGIPSQPVLILNDDPANTRLLVSVGSTNPDDYSDSQGAGIYTFDLNSDNNFTYIWWRDWVLP